MMNAPEEIAIEEEPVEEPLPFEIPGLDDEKEITEEEPQQIKEKEPEEEPQKIEEKKVEEEPEKEKAKKKTDKQVSLFSF